MNFNYDYLVEQALALGITRHQLSKPNFSLYTLNAIKRDLNQGMDLESALARYQFLTPIQIEGVTVLGLTNKQVSAANFGFHTIEAIKKDLINGVNLQTAYALIQYPVALKEMQELHTKASLCLEQGDVENFPYLVQYLEKSIDSHPTLKAYHQQRKALFCSRADACEVALNLLGIKHSRTKIRIDSEKKSDNLCNAEVINMREKHKQEKLKFFKTYRKKAKKVVFPSHQMVVNFPYK